MGLAVTIRLDAALIAPAFAILLLTELPGWHARIVRALIAGVIVILLPLLICRACGQHFLDSFAIVDRGLKLWDRHNSVLRNDTAWCCSTSASPVSSLPPPASPRSGPPGAGASSA